MMDWLERIIPWGKEEPDPASGPEPRAALPEDVLRRIRAIHIRTNYLANEVMAGEYESAFRGRGMEFEEVREYSFGDDVRMIDWNVTARMGHPYVKLYREEREMTMMLLVDLSTSQKFGSGQRLKSELAAELAAVLAYTAIKSNDKVGLIIFTDRVEKFIPPKKGRGHVWRVIREILSFAPVQKDTRIEVALDYLNRVVNKRSIAFLVSDFLTTGFEKSLKIANQKHDLVAIHLSDPREEAIPKIGLVELEDAETGERVVIDTSDFIFERDFETWSRKVEKERTKLFRSLGVDLIRVRTDRSYTETLIRFFRMREKRR
ncbi:MAG: DUF58 domain-containing protein [Proteobacteria bacterium]|nr:DUF58 domain-containing protein [Pseudomonadota bacterium]